jgi:hypothetical protein
VSKEAVLGQRKRHEGQEIMSAKASHKTQHLDDSKMREDGAAWERRELYLGMWWHERWNVNCL